MTRFSKARWVLAGARGLPVALGVGILAFEVLSGREVLSAIIDAAIATAVTFGTMPILAVRSGWVHRMIWADFLAGRIDQGREALRAIERWLKSEPALLTYHRYLEGTALSAAGRHHDAIECLLPVDRTNVRPGLLSMWLNNAAWSLVAVGRGDLAEPMARESIELSGQPGKDYQRGTWGAALTLIGRHEHGLALLDSAIADGGSPTHQAARYYFRGEALRGLGRTLDALESYRRSVAEKDDGEFASRAQAAANELSSSADRR